MPVFSISYDLIKLVKYDTLWAELERIGARRYLLSQWAVRTADGVTADALGLRQFVHSEDRLFVTRIDGSGWVSWNAFDQCKRRVAGQCTGFSLLAGRHECYVALAPMQFQMAYWFTAFDSATSRVAQARPE